jgi:copper chaperone CopZ
MQTATLEAPAVYGDHHVSEVRRILLEQEGVTDVYASSAFHTIEVTFDTEKTSADKIKSVLEQAGYLGELPLLAETGVAAYGKEGNGFFRHTAVYETLQHTISFTQRVQHQGRPLWPCPGFGAVKMVDNE